MSNHITIDNPITESIRKEALEKMSLSELAVLLANVDESYYRYLKKEAVIHIYQNKLDLES